MTSLLETRLQTQISEASDADTRAVKRAELACYWARTGKFNQANEVRAQLRSDFGGGQNVKVSILIILLEGLLHFYKDLSPHARDRVLRAQFLSKVFQDRSLLAISSAWLAHIDFNICAYISMAENVQTCIENLDYDDGSAECRLALLLGDAFLCCQNRSLSQAWYERARHAYAALGDQASIGSITYNRAAINATNARLFKLTGKLRLEELRTIDREINSAFNWQALVNLTSLEHLLHLARLSIFMVEENYESAAAIADRLFEEELIPLHTSQYQVAFVDRIRCHFEIGNKSRAKELIGLISLDKIAALEFDDQAIVFDNLSSVYGGLADTGKSIEYAAAANLSILDHAKHIGEIFALIEPFSSAAKS